LSADRLIQLTLKISQASIFDYKASLNAAAFLHARPDANTAISAATASGRHKRLTKPKFLRLDTAPDDSSRWGHGGGDVVGGPLPAGSADRTGGMGQVWAAHDAQLGRDLAIKVQQFDPAGDEVAFERFQREAQNAAGLQHPNVVTIFDNGTNGNMAFLVLELLPGPTLQTYVAERGPLPEQDAVTLAAAVASGLVAAHRAGVVHRDIKPTNLMFDGRGGLKISESPAWPRRPRHG
jgi:hypothetical protein